MTEGQPLTTDSWDRTQNFFREAIAEGAHKIKPMDMPDDQWIRQRNITGIYAAFPSASLQKIGKVYGLSRERVRQIRTDGTKLIWENSSNDLKQKYPYELLGLSKHSSLWSWESRSAASRGIGIRIKEVAQEGKSVQQMVEDSGLSSRQIICHRTRLKDLGIIIPYTNMAPQESKEIVAKLSDPTLPDDDIQRALNNINRNLYNRFMKGDTPLFAPLAKVGKLAGLSKGFQSKQLEVWREIVASAGIPLGVLEYVLKSGPDAGSIVRYNFIVAHHVERATQALLDTH